MVVVKGVLWFIVYLVLFTMGGAAIFSILFWVVGGTERLFQIPFVYPLFKACPLVFLAMSWHMSRKKVLGDSVETIPPSREGSEPGNKIYTTEQLVILVRQSQLFWTHILALVILGLAFVEWSEYGVYTLIRFACCAAFVRLSWNASKVGDTSWVWVWGILAAAYNPFVPLSIGRSVWVWVNFAGIGIILFDVIRLSPKRVQLYSFVWQSIACLLILWCVVDGGIYYFSEVLPEQRARESAERQEFEERKAEWERMEQDARIREIDPSWGTDSWGTNTLAPIDLLPGVDYSENSNQTTEAHKRSWVEEERKKREDDSH